MSYLLFASFPVGKQEINKRIFFKADGCPQRNHACKSESRGGLGWEVKGLPSPLLEDKA